MKDEQLIFVVSQPRAGSTLLQNILSNNKQVNTVSEPWILLGLAPILNSKLATTKYDYGLTLQAIKQFEDKHPNFNLVSAVKKIANSFYNEMLIDNYSYVLDKTPRYYEILDVIQELYPKAKIIIIKRNPFDVVYSLIKKRNITTSKELLWNNRDLLNAPTILQKFITKNVNNKNVISLTYENMVSHPESMTIELYKSLGLIYNKEVLNIAENNKTTGKLGDQNINSTKSFSYINAVSIKPKLNRELKSFIKGYAHFLGHDFLNDYGAYQYPEYGSKKTLVFNAFLKKTQKINNSLNTIIYNKFNKK